MRIAPAPCDQAIRSSVPRWASGIAALDEALSGGLMHGRVHEVYAAGSADAAAAAGFVVAMATGMSGQGKDIVWLRACRSVRQSGVFQANGWAELGGAPDQGLLGIIPDTMVLLRTAIDALRCAALGAVIVEGWGTMSELDLTASRRLALAAEKSGVPLILLRTDAVPTPSAAQTRWQVAAAPSRALPGRAPGMPVFDIELLRQKSGPSGLHWRLEWDRDQRQFRDAALSGAVVHAPVHRPVADRNAAPRQAA